ncbi:MAG: dockerin type I domain-containing protein [Candidatus Roizmanbacteria bacterium]|nr:dockerin type I domain-containing protein [Candidatus Roizmanbacteria bacterium]
MLKSSMKSLAFLFICVLLLNTVPTAQAASSVPSFPGAEGFGAQSIGGRGGKVIEITNLNDSGTGSLRACVDATGARTCVFRVSGTIQTTSIITIKNPYITIAGQSAPGQGIMLKAAPSYGKGSLAIRTHDVIIRHIRFRTGPSTDSSPERRGITVESASSTNTPYNIILDHVSISWATDDNLTLIDGVRNFTVQWSIISEALDNSTHTEGAHSKGFAISGKMFNSSTHTENVSVHHNLLAHNSDRNVRHAAWGIVDMVNNIVYDWDVSAIEANDGQTKVPMNIVSNYFKLPSVLSSGSVAPEVIVDDGEGNGGASIYVFGNIGPHRSSDSLSQDLIVYSASRSYIVPTKFSTPAITTSTASQAYANVLAQAGARLPYFDTVDQRIINEVQNATGRIIDDPSDVGGWPVIQSVIVDNDADNDGMDDPWEISSFGNTSRGSSTNSSVDFDSDGYTDLEEFLNGTNPKVAGGTTNPTLTPTSVPAQVPGDANGDGHVTMIDLSTLLSHFGRTGTRTFGDFDGNGTVNMSDLSVLLANFGR